MVDTVRDRPEWVKAWDDPFNMEEVIYGVDQPGRPDYAGAAGRGAESAYQYAQRAAMANRANQYNPFGSSVWQQGPGGQWAQNVSFSPEQQALFEQSQQGKAALMGQGTPSFGANRERVMEAMMSRGMGDIGRSREQKRSELIAQGIPPGSPAFNNEMDRFSRQEVDLRQQAEIGATQQAGQEYGAELAGRGQQAGFYNQFAPQMPQFGSYAQQATTPGADYLSAALGQGQFDLGVYNARVAEANQKRQGLFDIGSSAMSAYGGGM